MPRVYKIVSLKCSVCGKTYRFRPKDDMFIEVNEAEPTVNPCLWCSVEVERLQRIYIKELKRATAQR